MSKQSGHKDQILEFFVNAANKRSFALDITLNVKGCLVTGTLISAKEYFEELSEHFEQGNDMSRKISEQLASAVKGLDSNKSEEVHFIHMKHVNIYFGDRLPTPAQRKTLWRGKLEKVDGFFLGRITDGA
ncbi:gas vesicle accessory protein GvpU [Halalkalibacter oceani]|uniref:gas vesicle accessory protein GvpU n=1 Tax=Halalkalibacter oceani TaxID=1653776 RepID=UPI003398A93C